jgi:NAD(P)H-hydrate repair Nnr-like enzyme with NAD(P)H-hydrate dehydratase domain
MTRLAGALVINIGTLSPHWVEAMLLAGKTANDAGIPVVLDPVGAGATTYRTETARRILGDVDVAVLRGNAGEVATLVGVEAEVRGVESMSIGLEPAALAREAARALGVVASVTGPVDYVSDGKAAIAVANGHELLATVSGTGCMSSALTGCFLAAKPEEPPAAPAARPAGAPGNGGRRLTPEERAARVAAAVASKGVPGQVGASARQGETHRLLAMVPPEGIQRTEARQEDKVNVWPHLLNREAVAAFGMFAFVTVFSFFVNAPLLALANSNLTPNPSKAPWYFLGLQELLRYFHPMVAGVTIPGVGLLLLMAAPYLDRNPSMRPENRKLAILLFTTFVMFWAVLVVIGSFFRGPGFNWIWPWSQGLFFEL